MQTGIKVPSQVEETAFAIPQSFGPHGSGHELPRPLSAADAAALRKAFQAQRQGDFISAIRYSEATHDPVLLGDLLAARYLNPDFHPNAPQLKLWLATYGNYADAEAIQGRLIEISPPGTVRLQHFVSPLLPSDTEATIDAMPEPDPVAASLRRNAALDRMIADCLTKTEPALERARHIVDTTKWISSVYRAQLYAEIALGALSAGQNDFALSTAVAGFAASKNQLGYAAFVAGLAAWQDNRYRDALVLFNLAADAPLSQVTVKAGASYWAARVEKRLGHVVNARAWLRRAAAMPDTFYGILARQTSKQRPSPRPHQIVSNAGRAAMSNPVPVMGEVDIQAVEATPQGRQLFALLQIGETARAEAVLRRMWRDIEHDRAMCHSVQLVASAAGLQRFASQVATILAASEAQPAALPGFPMPHLAPRHGFRMDPALIYALTKIESNFNPKAASSGGAHGLMQIKPQTASFVVGPKPSLNANGVAIIKVPSDMVGQLRNPAINLDIGQKYLTYLAALTARTESAPEGGDLLHTLASYNAGPGAIARWENNTHNDDIARDPLLFLETIPFKETRNYVRNALTYLWIYADKMNLPMPSLNALAQARWPEFAKEQQLAFAAPTLH
ncbi:lytic transglycosylase domain-containing protein [Sorlinia euscelidii]